MIASAAIYVAPIAVPFQTPAETVPSVVIKLPVTTLVPPIVRASVSKVPSISALPEISKLAASISPGAVNTLVLGLNVNPVSTSAALDPDVPVTNTGYIVSSSLTAVTVNVVALVPAVTLEPPIVIASASRVPSKYASLN